MLNKILIFENEVMRVYVTDFLLFPRGEEYKGADIFISIQADYKRRYADYIGVSHFKGDFMFLDKTCIMPEKSNLDYFSFKNGKKKPMGKTIEYLNQYIDMIGILQGYLHHLIC